MRYLPLLLLIPFVASGCEPASEPACVPGASAACACTGGLAGAQVCDDDGRRYGACVCGEDVDAGAKEADGAPDDVATADTGSSPDTPEDPGGGPPRLLATPDAVSFGVVPVGQTDSKTLTLRNTGSGSLVVTHLGFSGDGQFTLTFGGLHGGPSGSLVLAEPLVLAPGESEEALITFAPLETGHKEALLRVFSNDPSLPEGLAVEIRGNLYGPCLEVKPLSVSFGTVPTGAEVVRTVSLRSCGDLPVSVTRLELDPDFTHASLVLDLSDVPGLEAGPPTADEPLVISHNAPIYLEARYAPVEQSEVDADGLLLPHEGRLVVESDGDAPVVVPLVGRAVGQTMLIAVASIEEGMHVVPQTLLHLRGDESVGGVATYEWAVEQPIGSQSVFVPGPDVPEPTFEVNVAGTYTFSLIVRDTYGQASEPALLQVVVVPDQAIHVELLWDTPNDANQSDEGPEAGSDLDLHFAHEYASGPDLTGDGAPDGWFDQPFDCFWFNPAPNWGSFDPAVEDDPSLDRDDTDGAGPENLNLDIPENGRTYRIGVHYWHDHQLGPSWATLRVYVYGQLVWHEAGVKLLNHDLWEAATIEWPSGKVTPLLGKGGGHAITKSYENPFFFQP